MAVENTALLHAGAAASRRGRAAALALLLVGVAGLALMSGGAPLPQLAKQMDIPPPPEEEAPPPAPDTSKDIISAADAAPEATVAEIAIVPYNATADRSKVTPAMQSKKDAMAKIEASYASIVPHTPEYAKARDQYAKVKMELNALSAARAIELGQINAARFKHMSEVGTAAKNEKIAAHEAKVKKMEEVSSSRADAAKINLAHQQQYKATRNKKNCEVWATQQGYIAAGKMDPATAMADPGGCAGMKAPGSGFIPTAGGVTASPVAAPAVVSEVPPPPAAGDVPPPPEEEAPAGTEDPTLAEAEAAMAEGGGGK